MAGRTAGSTVARTAGRHPGIVRAGRAGWAAKGVVYLIAGLLALLVVAKARSWSTTSGSQEASPTGAIKTIGGTGGGALLLYVLAAGMVLYALWRLVSALLPASSDAKVTAKRIGYVISAVIYTTFAATAVSLARTKSKVPDGNSKVTDMTARLMGHAFGRGLIGVIGAIVIGVGLYRIGKGAKRDVEDELDLSSLSPERKRWTRRLGAIGEIGRGTAIALIGFFLLRAAMTFNANEATGLDGALRRLAIHSWGQLVVAVVGVGFVAYGVFCLSTFTHRRLEGAS